MLNTGQQFFKQLEKSQNILVVFANDWNGDAVSSALALLLLCEKMERKIEIAASPDWKNHQTEQNSTWSFLPSFEKIANKIENLRKFIVSLNIKNAKVSQIKYLVENDSLNFIISPTEGWFSPEDISSSESGFKYDLIITINCQDLESLGEIYYKNIEFFYQTTVVNIDHQAENEEFGQINITDLNAVSTSEIIYELFKDQENIIDEDIATCLLLGIIAKTKNFKTANLTPKTLLNTSKLIGLGAKREEIINRLYRSRDFKVLKLWGKVLNNIHSEQNGLLVHSLISQKDFIETNTDNSCLSEIVDELIANLPEAKMIIIFTENIAEKTKALIYSQKGVDPLTIFKDYSVSGSSKFCQIELSGSSNEDIEIITTLAKKELAKLIL
ncbi:MAG: DHH family phosphoesterase [Patescibacteria group bacterium]